MVEAKDRRTNMLHSSVNAQPAKDGAGGSYVWGSRSLVTDYEPRGIGHVGLQIKKDLALPEVQIFQDAYVNDLDDFPALAPAAGATAQMPVAKAEKAAGTEKSKASATLECGAPEAKLGRTHKSKVVHTWKQVMAASRKERGIVKHKGLKRTCDKRVHKQKLFMVASTPSEGSSTIASTDFEDCIEPHDAIEFEPDLTWQPLTAAERKGNLKAVRKEGGMVGIDLEGASHLGGTQFFCNRVVEPRGDHALLLESIAAMNAPEKKVKRAHEVRAGCSADVAKIIVSSNPGQIQVAAYVPKALQSKLKPIDWLQEIMTWYGGTMSFTCSSGELCVGIVDDLKGYGMGYEILVCHHATDTLQRLGLMASSDHTHHHDDEIFGDDDLIGMSESRKSTIREARKSTVKRS